MTLLISIDFSIVQAICRSKNSLDIKLEINLFLGLSFSHLHEIAAKIAPKIADVLIFGWYQ